MFSIFFKVHINNGENMIDYYKIKNENNENVLYVYLNFSFEFGNFDFKDFGKNLRTSLNNIVSKHNLNKIKIIVSSTLIATLLVVPVNINDTYNSKNIIYINENTLLKDNDFISNINNKIKNDIKVDTKIDIVTNTDTPNNIKNDTNSSNNEKTTTTVKNENTNKDIIEDNNTYVTIHRSNGNIISLELEEYLIGVVASEMPASFNEEALKAQTVVARTYTLKRISENKIMTDTTSTQVYKDNNELKNMWKNDYDKYYNKIKNIVNSTKGISIKYNGKYIDAVYHSTSNGYTEDAIYVWGNDIPYLKSTTSPWDKNVGSYEKSITLSYKEISNKLNINIDENIDINLKRNSSNRVTEVIIDNTIINGTTFRNKLNLRSTDFNIIKNSDNLVITTYGYGHGVGMSQYGANEMAKLGYNYKDILNHYYKGITITL